jgi:hypothetical protein
MADIIRIKRRVSGSPGAPSSLANAELAYNEADHILYYGEGTGGSGGSASVISPIAGQGLASTAVPVVNGTGAAGSAAQWARGDHVHPTDTSRAPLASPALTGTPTAPTNASPADNSNQIATDAFVHSAIAAVSSGVTNITTQDGLSGGGSGSVTIGVTQIAVAKGGTGAATLTGYVKGAGTAALTASPTIPNTDIAGLGNMSVQSSSAVSITGGTIDGITLDGGTFVLAFAALDILYQFVQYLHVFPSCA